MGIALGRIRQQRERRFRVDFGRTRYVDSSGLGVLVAMSKKVKQERGTPGSTHEKSPA